MQSVKYTCQNRIAKRGNSTFHARRLSDPALQSSRRKYFDSVFIHCNSDIRIGIPCAVNNGIGNHCPKRFFRNPLNRLPEFSLYQIILVVFLKKRNRLIVLKKYRPVVKCLPIKYDIFCFTKSDAVNPAELVCIRKQRTCIVISSVRSCRPDRLENILSQ